MVTYLSGLENDLPDKVLEQQLCTHGTTIETLIKLKIEKEDRVRLMELEIKVMKEQLKIHAFAIDTHEDKTMNRDEIVSAIFREMQICKFDP